MVAVAELLKFLLLVVEESLPLEAALEVRGRTRGHIVPVRQPRSWDNQGKPVVAIHSKAGLRDNTPSQNEAP